MKHEGRRFPRQRGVDVGLTDRVEGARRDDLERQPAPAGSVVDTNYTMVGKLPKTVLGAVTAYDRTDDRLRAVAADYLRTR